MKLFAWRTGVVITLVAGLAALPATAQPAALNASQLDQLVGRIALYPDPLLAQVLAASSYWDQIPEAAAWADQHSYLKGDALAKAIQEDHLQWEPSVLALLPFPSVLDMMASDPAWTQQLGNAVLTQRAEIMDEVQRLRKKARDFGYLQPSPYVNVVNTGGYIEIQPVEAATIYVPEYDPLVVFAPPRPGFAIGGAIRFGPGIVIGAAFSPFGWFAGPAFAWRTHTILIDRHPWVREWAGRAAYAHPYAAARIIGPRVERHELRGRLHR